MPPPQGPCRREMEDTLNHLKFLNMLSPRGIHIPNCDKKGFYKKKQVGTVRPSADRPAFHPSLLTLQPLLPATHPTRHLQGASPTALNLPPPTTSPSRPAGPCLDPLRGP